MRGRGAESILESQLILISAQLLRLGLGLLVTVLLVRGLDDAGWSAFVLLGTAFAFLAQVVDAGLQPALVAELSSGEGPRSGLMRRILGLRLAIALLALLSGLVFPELLPRELPILIVGLVILTLPLRTWNALFAASQRNRVTALGGLVIHVVFVLALLVILNSARDPVVGVLLALCGRELLLSLYPFLRAIRFESGPVRGKSADAPSRLWLLSAATIMGAGYLYLDVFMLEWMKGEREVGSYGLATRLVLPVMIAANLMAAPFVPFLSRRFQREGRLAPLVLLEIALVLLASLLPAVVCFESGGAVIEILRGAADDEAASSLRQLALVPLAVVFAGVASLALIVTRHYGSWALATALGFVLNVILNARFIPADGAAGAAWATLLTEFSVAILAWLFLWLQGRSATEKRRFSFTLLAWALIPSALLLLAKKGFGLDEDRRLFVAFLIVAVLSAGFLTLRGPGRDLRARLQEEEGSAAA